jgi:hypothetical protein
MALTLRNLIFALIVASLLQACSSENAQNVVASSKLKLLTVYKSPTCGCCGDWVAHIESAGFEVRVIEDESMAALKDRFGIPANARSCHTAVSDSGAVFEGHVPAKTIERYLAKKNDGKSLGLTVPGMPVGSPGMEVGDKFMPYAVLELSKAGTTTTFEQFQNYESQF